MRGKERFSAPERSPAAIFSKHTIFCAAGEAAVRANALALD